MGSLLNFQTLKKKAPQIVIIVIAVAILGYFLAEILEDVLLEGAPWNSGPVIGPVVGFLGNATATVSSWGYNGIFSLMMLEASSLPIPSEVILPFAGYLVSVGTLNIWITLAVATAAATLGSLIDYYIGLKGVEALAKYRLLGKAVFSEAQIKVVAGWFYKYGSIMVFLGRMIPGFRTIISFPAGAVKMPLSKFLIYTVGGCLMWNSVLIYVGYYLGTNWQEVAGVSHYLLIAVVVFAIALFVAFLIYKRRKKKNNQAQTVQA